MKEEVSAGGVVIRKLQNAWHVLLMKDMNSSWTFPKGIIEAHENPETAAKREIAEEVGLTELRTIQRLGEIGYYYKKNGLIKKTVTYFLFRSEGNKHPSPQREEGITEVGFFPFTKALSMVGYVQTNKPLLERAQTVIQSL